MWGAMVAQWRDHRCGGSRVAWPISERTFPARKDGSGRGAVRDVLGTWSGGPERGLEAVRPGVVDEERICARAGRDVVRRCVHDVAIEEHHRASRRGERFDPAARLEVDQRVEVWDAVL